MTLIVGIRCRDGIVIGADSAATLGGSGGVMTISQPTQKIDIIDGKIIVACAGSAGMAQRVAQEIGRLWSGNAFTGTKCSTDVDAGLLISNAIRPHLISEASVAQQLRIPPPPVTSVVSIPVAKKLTLIEIADNGAPEIVPATVPFVAIGSGKPLADPFLGFLRRIFWPSTEPTLSEGTFAAVWTLDQCIRTSVAFLSQPVHIAEARATSGGFAARILSQEELEEPREFIKVAEQGLANFRAGLASANPPTDIPTPV